MELYILNGNDPQSLDPTQINGTAEGRIYRALFEGLVREDPRTAKAIPGVAESWTYSNDNSVITFRLRADITWSDGTPITAQTVVDSWLHHLNPTTASGYASMMGMVVKGADDYNTGTGRPQDVGIRAIDARTFEVTLVGPVPYALDMMTHWVFSPLPMHIIQAHGNNWTRPENIVGNGPFVLQEYIPNSRLVVVPNERYWDKANVYLTKITFDPNDDANTRTQMYLASEADWCTDVAPSRIDELKLHKDYQVSPMLGVFYFIINCRDHPGLDNPLVRKALSMAINRQELVDNVARGGQIIATGLIPPMGSYVPTPGNGYNVAEARRLLAEAGYSNGQGFPTYEFVYRTNENTRIIGEYLQQEWRNSLGINITLRNMESGAWFDFRRTPPMQITQTTWVFDYMDPQNLLDNFTTNSGHNHGHYSNPAYDQLIRQVAAMPDGAARDALMRQAEDLALTGDQVVIPVYYAVNQDLIDLNKWDGWYPNAMGTHPYVGMRRK
jgi:oligopeptide transport system substrate-binding protein